MTENFAILAVIFVLCAALAVLGFMLWRARPADDQHAAAMDELTQAHAEAATRLEAMIRMLGDRQSQLQNAVNERLDAVSHRLGDSLEKTKQSTAENLTKLNERLAVIDSAQKNITALATQVTSLQGVLANKQSRGAFGQGQMEAIIRDRLPKSSYEFQYTLSNRSRPDCCVFLADKRPLVIDAKFPLEAVTAFRDAKTDDERKVASQRVRADVTKHIADIAGKYLIPGETHDLAFMFVPSESVYAELHDGFDDVVQKAFRAKVVIVSPSLLMVAVHVIQQIQKDARMREAAGEIQAEVGKLVDDVTRMHERVLKLQQHFGQTAEDVRQIVISAEKIEKRGARIKDVEIEDDTAMGEIIPAAPLLRKLEAGE
ncbi:MAG TPA: DNA recombination protein RmuC [Xanthobacteraceae bacterium]|jgi:DNA recombination protein RmuC|nr:DNA recombination protein RmuC [Xanthobacteraceae bacterium]